MENQQHWFNIGGFFPCRPQCYFCTSCRHEFLSLLHYSWHSRCFLLSKLHTRHGRSSGSSLTLPEGLNGSIRFNPGLNESHLFAWIIRHHTCGRIDRRQDLSEYWWAGLAFGLCPSCGGARVWVCWTQVTFFFKINELFSVCVGHLKFCQGGTWRSKVEWSQSKPKSLVHVPVPMETAPAYLPGLHQMEFTSCDHLKIKKAVVLMSFMAILLRSLFWAAN